MGPPHAEVWVARPCSPDKVQHLLNDEERARLARFRFDADASSYASAHALLRLALTERDPRTAPSGWRFRTAEFGKPEIEAPAGDQGREDADLRFNLSHSRGFVATATLRGGEIGVDVEAIRTLEVARELRSRVLSPLESEALDALPPALQPERFFSIWSLKESYIKARGLGLRLPLREISFSFHGSHVAQLSETPRLDADEPSDWTVGLRRLDDPAHALAVTAASQGGPPVTIQVRRVDLGPLAQSAR